MCAADALQQQSGDLRLAVKLRLGNTELMLCLVGGGEEERERKGGERKGGGEWGEERRREEERGKEEGI